MLVLGAEGKSISADPSKYLGYYIRQAAPHIYIQCYPGCGWFRGSDALPTKAMAKPLLCSCFVIYHTFITTIIIITIILVIFSTIFSSPTASDRLRNMFVFFFRPQASVFSERANDAKFAAEIDHAGEKYFKRATSSVSPSVARTFSCGKRSCLAPSPPSPPPSCIIHRGHQTCPLFSGLATAVFSPASAARTPPAMPTSVSFFSIFSFSPVFRMPLPDPRRLG